MCVYSMCAVGRQMDWLISVPVWDENHLKGASVGSESLILHRAIVHSNLKTFLDMHTYLYNC